MPDIVADGTPGEDNIQESYWNSSYFVTSHMGDSNDYFAGWFARYLVYGEGGDDRITSGHGGGSGHGGDGNDTLYGQAISPGIVNNLYGDDGEDYLWSWGGDAPGTNNLSGGAGIDRLGDSHGMGADVFDGGDGFDWVEHASPSGITVSLATGSGSGGNAAGNTYASIEGLYGTPHADGFTGSNGNNVLLGANGADTLAGGAGNDLLIGYGIGQFFEQYTGTRNQAPYATNTFNNTESSAFNPSSIEDDGSADSLDGGSGNDVLYGGAGADTLNGGANRDIAVYYGSNAAVQIDLTAATAAGGFAAGDVLSNIEDLHGSDYGDTLTGNAAANLLRGRYGNDTLNGAGGPDDMSGNEGDDTYYVDHASDKTTEAVSQGYDTVHSTIAWRLSANTEALILDGAAPVVGNGNELANVITGNTGNNLLQGFGENDTIAGGQGADRLDGGIGIDSMTGGLGDDIYYVDSFYDATVEEAAQGSDTVYTALGITLAANIEILRFNGNNAATGTGNEINNVMTSDGGGNTLQGLGGNDQLAGYGGNDRLEGGDNDDVLTGGDGADTLLGGAGNDTLRGNTGADRFVFAQSGAGTDVVADFNQAEGDRFDLQGGAFTSMSLGANNNTVLRHAGGTIVVAGVQGLNLAQWNALTAAPAAPEFEATPAYDWDAPSWRTAFNPHTDFLIP